MKKPQSSATLTDLGYSHMPRGWYDAQGSGFSIDYGRYVGDGNAANPTRWAVALAGKTDQYDGSYSEPNNSLLMPNCWGIQSSATLTDLGYSHMPRGWYDAQGSGLNIDYGRYVGDGNAANPTRWAVALAGKTDQYDESYSEPDNSLLMPDHVCLRGNQMKSLIDAEWPNTRVSNQTYADRTYHCLSVQNAKDIWNKSGLGGFKWTAESFDCDDFSYVYKGTVSKHVYELKLKIPYTVGVVFGYNSKEGHAVNIFIDEGYNVKILEPQNGTVIDGKDWDYKPNFVLM
mmetsp:Transcript_18111/g.36365  ORF Transcript_18111/g.36365 Transcript_18111/m.36365 type:complete len:287 (-) Transcript_18111:110-970(-)